MQNTIYDSLIFNCGNGCLFEQIVYYAFQFRCAASDGAPCTWRLKFSIYCYYLLSLKMVSCNDITAFETASLQARCTAETTLLVCLIIMYLTVFIFILAVGST